MTAEITTIRENNVVPTKPADNVRYFLEKMKPQMQLALPKHLTADRLLRVAMTAIQNTPKLLECDRTSLLSAVMMCAQLGLEPDGVLGQAYLIPFGGKVQFIPGYRGLISLARNSGEVASIAAHEVCENDHFAYSFGLNEKLEHTPARGERGEIIYFYAIARFKDGGYHWDVMTKEQVIGIRDKSAGWQTALKYKATEKSPWHNHFVEMGKKTVIRRIAKYLPMSVQKAAAISDAFDTGRYATLDNHGELVIDKEPVAAQIEQKEPAAHDPTTGEVAPEAPAKETKPPAAPMMDAMKQFDTVA
jgi:recombination protein RecT